MRIQVNYRRHREGKRDYRADKRVITQHNNKIQLAKVPSCCAILKQGSDLSERVR